MSLSSIFKVTDHLEFHLLCVLCFCRMGLPWIVLVLFGLSVATHLSASDFMPEFWISSWGGIHSGQSVLSALEKLSPGLAAVTLRSLRWHLGNLFLALPCVLTPSSWLCLLSSWNPLFNEAPFPVGTWRTACGRLRFCSLMRLGAPCTPWHSSLVRWLQYGSNYSEIGRHCPIVL